VLLVATAGIAVATSGAGADHPVWGPVLAAHDAAAARGATSLAAAAATRARAESGLRASVEALPTVTWSGPRGLASAWVVTARVEWRGDAGARASAALAQHRALVTALESTHREVRDALAAYVALRRAYVAVAVAEAAVATRRATFEAAEASAVGRALDAAAGSAGAGAGAAVSDVELGLARLELERALAGVDRAHRDVASARRAAEARGFDAEAALAAHLAVLDPDPLEGWRLAPPPGTASSLLVERRVWEREVALARLAREGGWSVVDDVRVEAGVVGTDGRLRLALALDEGRPQGFAEASAQSASRSSWSVTLRARVRLDDTWAEEFAAAQRAAEEADAALLAAVDEAAWTLADLARDLADAEADVAFAERALALGRAALRALDDERVAVASAARRGEAGGEERLRRFDEAYARSLLGHLRERDAFVRAWERYARSAERAWLAVGAPFALRGP
jgi:hypothetical protein